jgi:hypothetical protein
LEDIGSRKRLVPQNCALNSVISRMASFDIFDCHRRRNSNPAGGHEIFLRPPTNATAAAAQFCYNFIL